VCRAAAARYGLSVNILRLAWPTPDHLWPAWGQVTPPARPAGPGGALACATAATDVAAAHSYRDGLQAFTISADELAGRWSTAKARDLLAWHPQFTPPNHPALCPVNPARPQPIRPVPAAVPPGCPRMPSSLPDEYRRELAGRLRQIHSFPAAAHRIKCWLPPRPGPASGCPRVCYAQNFWIGA
jgi:hypothetical protein